MLSAFFIAPNLTSAIITPVIVQFYSSSSPAAKPFHFFFHISVSFLCFGAAFLPDCSSIGTQILLRSIGAVGTSFIITITDSLTVKYTQIHAGSYGKHRLYGAVSWAISSIALGYLVDVTGNFEVFLPIAAFSGIFTGYLGHKLVSDIEASDVIDYQEVFDDANAALGPHGSINTDYDSNVTADVSQGSQTSNPLKALGVLASTPLDIAFVLSVLCLSLGTSLVESLSFAYFTSVLSAGSTLNGFTVAVTVMFEIPLFHYADTIMGKLGYTNAQVLAMLAYSTRVYCYTVVPKAWMVLLLEPLHGVTYALSKSASVEHVSRTADGDVGQSVMNTIRGNVGPIMGLILAGVVGEYFSQQTLYRSFGLGVGLVVVLYKCLLCLSGAGSGERESEAEAAKERRRKRHEIVDRNAHNSVELVERGSSSIDNEF